jgi:hypothetical protein
VTSASIFLAAGALAAWTLHLALAVRTRRALLPLPASAPAALLPTLSVVVPCRDEARGVEATIRSLAAQDLPGLEIVAVDDRSTDGTGAILDRLAAGEPRLRVVHLSALPPAWLGKTHACAAGARRATGAWLLFTDGDVLFAPGVLRRALATAVARRLGHLAVLPLLVAPGFAERAFVTAFAALLSPLPRIWQLPRAGTRGYFGVGAFNLVRRDAYEAAGGHARIAFEVVDDVKLGLLLRRSGVPQGVAESGGLVSVRWQHGFLPSALGLVKNAFAAVEYRSGTALAGALAGLGGGLLPLALAIAAPSAAARALALAALLVSMADHALWARRGRGSGVEALLLPVCAALLGAVVLASAVLAWWRGAVVWRGTRYPLDALRAGCLRAADLPPAGAVGWPTPDEPSGAPAAAARAIAPTRARFR